MTMSQKTYLGQKVEAILMNKGARRPVGVIMELLDLGERYANRFLDEGILPDDNLCQWREEQLVKKLELASIDEIVAKSKSEQAA